VHRDDLAVRTAQLSWVGRLITGTTAQYVLDGIGCWLATTFVEDLEYLTNRTTVQFGGRFSQQHLCDAVGHVDDAMFVSRDHCVRDALERDLKPLLGQREGL